MEHEENCELDEGNSLPLCFSSFKFLKENFKIINEGKECELMQSHIGFWNKMTIL
jgi:hypothetical protein